MGLRRQALIHLLLHQRGMEMAGIDQDQARFRHGCRRGVVAWSGYRPAALPTMLCTNSAFYRCASGLHSCSTRLPKGEDAMPDIMITPLTNAIGAEIGGGDLSNPLHDLTQDALSIALPPHLALASPDPSLTPAH